MNRKLESAEFDVLVAGAGPVGQIAALAVSRLGLSVALVGPTAPPDRRTTALMAPALEFLENIGVGPLPEHATAALRSMRIIDGTRRLIRSAPVTFHAGEVGEDAFGYNIANADLTALLAERIAAQPAISRFEAMVGEWMMGDVSNVATLDHGSQISASLTIAADGRNSPARTAAGITAAFRPYPQAALVLNFSHSRDHGFVSTEFHTETGPFTVVPLPGKRSSLVWVVSPEEADSLKALDDPALSARIEARMQSLLGAVTVEAGRQIFPLGSLSPSSMAARRTVLVGEAAHVLPPIGAQGMNLGIRDVAVLVRILTDQPVDPGSEAVLASYRSARRLDVMARSGAVDLLNRSLLTGFLPLQMVRSAGLSLLSAAAPLRGFVMREGLLPGSGWADIGSALRKKVGRQQS